MPNYITTKHFRGKLFEQPSINGFLWVKTEEYVSKSSIFSIISQYICRFLYWLYLHDTNVGRARFARTKIISAQKIKKLKTSSFGVKLDDV